MTNRQNTYWFEYNLPDLLNEPAFPAASSQVYDTKEDRDSAAQLKLADGYTIVLYESRVSNMGVLKPDPRRKLYKAEQSTFWEKSRDFGPPIRYVKLPDDRMLRIEERDGFCTFEVKHIKDIYGLHLISQVEEFKAY